MPSGTLYPVTGSFLLTGYEVPPFSIRAQKGAFAVTGVDVVRFGGNKRLYPTAGQFAINTVTGEFPDVNLSIPSVLEGRTISISLRFPTPVTSATMRFLPDLSAGDGVIVLEKIYSLTLTSDTPSKTLSASINLPTKSVGSIPYRVQFPRETGYNEHYIYLNRDDNSAIDLATLLTLSEMTQGTVDLTDLNDVTIGTPVSGEYLRYNGSEWTDSAIQVGDLPASVMLKTTYDVDSDGVVDKAEQVTVVVRNDEATTLTAGTIVYVSGANGTHVLVKRAQANSEVTSSKTMGMVLASISPNADGQVAINGTVDSVNTATIPAGTALWLSASNAGQYTTTKPTQPDHSVFIGWVARKNANNGRIVLHIQNGYEIEELHNVLISTATNNDLLTYESSTQLWKNKSKATLDIASDSTVVKLTGNQTVAGNKTFSGVTKGNFQPSIALASGPDMSGYYEPNHTDAGLIAVNLNGDTEFLPPTGSPTNGSKMLMRINALTANWVLTWDSIYRAGIAPLPSAITTSQTIYLGFIYDGTYWDLVGSTTIS